MQIIRSFDDRQRDFMSGRLVSPPIEERQRCACCRLPIVKGYVTSSGPLGDDCTLHVQQSKKYTSVDDYETWWKRSTGWGLKPAVRKFLKEAAGLAA